MTKAAICSLSAGQAEVISTRKQSPPWQMGVVWSLPISPFMLLLDWLPLVIQESANQSAHRERGDVHTEKERHDGWKNSQKYPKSTLRARRTLRNTVSFHYINSRLQHLVRQFRIQYPPTLAVFLLHPSPTLSDPARAPARVSRKQESHAALLSRTWDS